MSHHHHHDHHDHHHDNDNHFHTTDNTTTNTKDTIHHISHGDPYLEVKDIGILHTVGKDDGYGGDFGDLHFMDGLIPDSKVDAPPAHLDGMHDVDFKGNVTDGHVHVHGKGEYESDTTKFGGDVNYNGATGDFSGSIHYGHTVGDKCEIDVGGNFGQGDNGVYSSFTCDF